MDETDYKIIEQFDLIMDRLADDLNWFDHHYVQPALIERKILDHS